MRRGVALRAIALLALTASGARALEVPPLSGRVVDRADILSPSTEAALTAQLAAHEGSTSNQIVVLTLPSLGGEILEPYATRVFREWGVAQSGTDNGVLLLVSRDDREVRIEVGYGLEGNLTDALSGQIIRGEIVPRFRAGDYDGGVIAGVDSILRAVGGEYEPVERRSIGTMNGVPLEDADAGERIRFGLLFSSIPLLLMLSIVVFSGDSQPKSYVGAGCLGLFAGAFVAAGMTVLLLNGRLGLLIGLVGVPLTLMIANALMNRVPLLSAWREGRLAQVAEALRRSNAKSAAFDAARVRGESTVVVEGTSYRVPPPPSRSSGSSGGGLSSSSFSGGGGSSGGGGASGSW